MTSDCYQTSCWVLSLARALVSLVSFSASSLQSRLSGSSLIHLLPASDPPFHVSWGRITSLPFTSLPLPSPSIHFCFFHSFHCIPSRLFPILCPATSTPFSILLSPPSLDPFPDLVRRSGERCELSQRVRPEPISKWFMIHSKLKITVASWGVAGRPQFAQVYRTPVPPPL